MVFYSRELHLPSYSKVIYNFFDNIKHWLYRKVNVVRYFHTCLVDPLRCLFIRLRNLHRKYFVPTLRINLNEKKWSVLIILQPAQTTRLVNWSMLIQFDLPVSFFLLHNGIKMALQGHVIHRNYFSIWHILTLYAILFLPV